MTLVHGVGWFIRVRMMRRELIDFIDWMEENCPTYGTMTSWQPQDSFRQTIRMTHRRLAENAYPQTSAIRDVWVWNDRDVVALKLRWDVLGIVWGQPLKN